MNAPGLTPEYPGSTFRYKDRELVFTLERPLKPVWTSKEGIAFREMLPATVGEAMQALAEAQKVLRGDGVFAGFNELFVSLYLGEEIGASTRDGYSVRKISKEFQTGDKVVETGLFGQGRSSSSVTATATGEKAKAGVPSTRPDVAKGTEAEVPAATGPTPTPAPR